MSVCLLRSLFWRGTGDLRGLGTQALEEERLRHQAQRERERVEEGLKLCRERAAEKARKEAAALEKQTREKELLEAKKEVSISTL